MDLIAALMEPSAYPEPTRRVDLIQTHISWVFITDDFAYKVKKPVDLGFLNFTTLRRRHHYLQEELSPQPPPLSRKSIWRSCPLRLKGTGCGWAAGAAGDYVLKMVRMPQERMMDEVADRGELGREHMDRIIDRLVPFYEQAATGPRINKYGEPAIIAYNHEENFSRTESLAGQMFPRELFEEIRDFARSFLARHRALFIKRIREGRIRDCHGDLHMKNICLADRHLYL